MKLTAFLVNPDAGDNRFWRGDVGLNSKTDQSILLCQITFQSIHFKSLV